MCNKKCKCEEKSCDCPVRDLNTDCITYFGEDLPQIGVKRFDSLTDIIKKIAEKFN